MVARLGRERAAAKADRGESATSSYA